MLKKWHNKGIGTVALKAFLDKIRARLGVTEYIVRIDPENWASQRVFEKLGAVPNGLAEIFLHDEEEQRQCEEENLHLLDEKLKSLAKQFDVEPRKLLSHVLEYSLTWS